MHITWWILLFYLQTTSGCWFSPQAIIQMFSHHQYVASNLLGEMLIVFIFTPRLTFACEHLQWEKITNVVSNIELAGIGVG